MPDEAVATSTQTPAETGSTATVATTAPVTTVTQPAQADAFDVSDYIAKDGKFTERFKELVPEDLRSNKVYDIFTDTQSLLKYVGNASVELGKYRSGKGVLPINEKSTPTEIDNFRVAMGVPKDGTGYQYKPPEDISSEDLSPEFLKGTFDELNKAHYTPAQAAVAMNIFENHLRTVEKAVDEELARQVSDAENKFNGEYGDQAPVRVELAKEFITKVVGHWNKGKYEELFGKEVKDDKGNVIGRSGGINVPEFAGLNVLLNDLFASVQEKFGIEDSGLIPEGTGTAAKSLKQQVEDAEKEVYDNVKLKSSLDKRDRDRYDQLVAQRDMLMKRLHPV